MVCFVGFVSCAHKRLVVDWAICLVVCRAFRAEYALRDSRVMTSLLPKSNLEAPPYLRSFGAGTPHALVLAFAALFPCFVLFLRGFCRGVFAGRCVLPRWCCSCVLRIHSPAVWVKNFAHRFIVFFDKIVVLSANAHSMKAMGT